MRHRIGPALGPALWLLVATASAARAQDTTADPGLPPPVSRPTTQPAPRPVPPRPLGPLPTRVMTGFDPVKDGLGFVNTGDYASEGDCHAMSLISILNYKNRRARPEDAEAARIGRLGADDFTARATAGNIQPRGERDEDDLLRKHPTTRVTNPSVGNEILRHMERTGDPVVFGFDSGKEGHAVVIFGYEDGKFLVYDPNYPGETHRLPFDSKKGFGKWDVDEPFYQKMDGVSWWPGEEASRATGAIARMAAACEARERACTDRYRPTTVALEGGAHETFVTGTIGLAPHPTRGGGLPATVRVYLDGQQVAHGTVRNNRFRVPVDAARVRDGTSVLEVVVQASDEGLVGIGRKVLGAPAPRTEPATETARTAPTPPTARGINAVLDGK